LVKNREFQKKINEIAVEATGIKQGDIITEIDGKKLTDDQNTSLATYINKKKIGDSVSVKIWRDNKEQEIMVKLEKKK